MTEYMLRDVAAAHPFNYCALRYFNVAGADPQGRTGQSTAGATHLIKVAVEAALGKRDYVGVFGTDYDTPMAPAYATISTSADLAAAHVIALANLFADPKQSHTSTAVTAMAIRCMQVLDAVDRVTNFRSNAGWRAAALAIPTRWCRTIARSRHALVGSRFTTISTRSSATHCNGNGRFQRADRAVVTRRLAQWRRCLQQSAILP